MNEAINMQILEALQQQVAQQNIIIQRLSPAENTREPKVPLPEKFNGNRKFFRNFITQINAMFTLNSSRFPNDVSKVLFIGSLLTGDAASWFESITRDTYDHNYTDFMENFRVMFSDPHSQTTARREIRELRQGKMSATTYCMRFMALSVDTGFCEESLKDFLEYNLNPQIQDIIATSANVPKDLKQFINFVISIDNRLFDRRRRAGLNGKPNNFQTVTNTSGPTPMDLGVIASHSGRDNQHAPLSKEEKDRRRREGLCMYCGVSGHLAKNCPAKNSRARSN